MKDWINSRNLKTALRFYLYGLLITAPVALFVSKTYGTEATFRVTGPLAIVTSCLLLSVEFLNHSAVGAAFLRRLLDIFVSISALIILAPLLLLVCIAIKIENPAGPIFFKRLVVGKDGKVFAKITFRTVRIETLLREEKHLRFVWKVANDPRVTRVGSFLRRSSLDELPQLFNVLRGDMTLVGPPPQIAALVAQHVVPVPHTNPGLTSISLGQFALLLLSGKARDIYTVGVAFDEYQEILRSHSVTDMPPVLCHQD